MPRLALAFAAWLAVASVAAAEQMMRPFKDELFAYPALLARSEDGRHITVDYRSERDITQRDEVPERRVRSRYIDLGVRQVQRDLVARTDVAQIPHMAVGAAEKARFIVVYLHGQGGSRRQGMDDRTFGGNFNRIKNLAARGGGLFLTTDFSDFGAAGAKQVSSLISHYLSVSSPRAQVYVACGSMGGALCWKLADDPEIAPRLGGLMLLGSHWDEKFLSSRAFSARVPVLFGHGSADKVFPVERQEAFFRSILARSSDYPVRFVRFETGSHGTPIRMTDWRDTLNWMNAAR